MLNNNPEDLLIIDIETASEYSSFEKVPEEWKQLWQEKVSRIVPEGLTPADFYPMRAGVMAEFSRVVCISIGYIKKDSTFQMRIKSFYGDDEKTILLEFISTINKFETNNKKWCFAGHNIKEFDIPFLCRRMIINSISLPPFLDFQHMKPWETNIVDTFQYWRFGDYKNFTSLKLLAASLGIPSPKDDIDGSMVGELFWNGNPEEREVNIKRIATYCQKDVLTTANIILRFQNMPLITPDNIEIVQ